MNVNSKVKKQDDFDIFDDDFEIIYEGDLPDICIDGKSDVSDNTEDPISPDDSDSSDTDFPGKKSSPRKKRPAAPEKEGKKSRRKSRGFKAPSLLSPIRKTARASGKAAAKIMKSVLRIATLIIILCIMCLITVRFASNYSAYGVIKNIAADRNYALGAYLGVAAVLLIYELITFFWALTSQKVRERHRNSRLDTGRGMFSFILMASGSYLSGIFCHLIPETYPALAGAKGGLTVYGSLSSTLLVLCAAGIISCLLRRFLPQ